MTLSSCGPATQATPLATTGAEAAARHDRPVVAPGGKVLKDLFVADASAGAVDIFSNGTYANAGTISSGLKDPDGVWVDAKGNLYVANVTGKT